VAASRPGTLRITDDLDPVHLGEPRPASPARQLPPRSTARSTITDPGRIDLDHVGGHQSRVAHGQELRRGVGGLTISCFLMWLGHQIGLAFAWYSLDHFLGITAGRFSGLLEPLRSSTAMNLGAQAFEPASLGGRPARRSARHDGPEPARPFAMACRPATPAPIIKILVAGTVPAAVIIIGNARPNSAARIDQPRRIAGQGSLGSDKDVHDLVARVMRGSKFHRERPVDGRPWAPSR